MEPMNRSFNHGDTGHHQRGREMEAAPGPGQHRMRSRTPGPDFMRRRDEEFFSGGGGGPDVHQPPRSKTPTHDHPSHHYLQQQQQQQQQGFQHHSSLSGTPDFIPASQYQASPPLRNNNPDIMYRPPPQHQSSLQSYPSTDSQYSNPPQQQPPRLNSSQSFGSALNSQGRTTPYNTQDYSAAPKHSPSYIDPNPNRLPRKQSTSFENVEPAPSNLTRLPRGFGSGVGGGAYEDEWLEMTVYLTRQESGFGFRIIGGTEEGSQVGKIHSITCKINNCC